jgi:hypothetical protein
MLLGLWITLGFLLFGSTIYISLRDIFEREIGYD